MLTKKATALGVAALITAVLIACWLAACGGSSSSNSATSAAKVTVHLGDPPTCSTGTGGAFGHVYVSISDVKIHQSSSAGPNDSGWVDLTPGLSAAPQQVDLLALGGNSCFLATLGSTSEIPAGTYQQIRLYLTPNSVTVSNNQCGNTNNCVVYNGTTVPLNLSSETQTGIKIPSGQIAGGNFTIAAGQVRDLVIDFDACSSLVVQGNGQFRLKPVLHAGEVSTVASSVTGQLVDSATNQPIAGAKAIVALEAPDANGVDRMVMQIAPDANGNFVFCPVPTGTFDLVAVVQATNGGTTTAYSASIVTGVQAGNALNKIPMHAQVTPNTQQGQITGTITTAGATAAIAEDITVSALQSITVGTSTTPTQFTIPLAQQQSATLSVTTATGTACAANTDCTTYTIGVPASLPYVGAFSASITYTQATGTGSAVPYTVDAMAFTPDSSATPTCSPTEQTVSVQQDGTTALAVTSGTTVTAKTLAFTGCQ